jgi:pimeloyl-ACP methyl ester carboxylesterase
MEHLMSAASAMSVVEAKRTLRAMQREPRPLARPLVIATGLYDPGFVSAHIRRVMRRVAGDERMVAVSFFWCMSFERCRARLIEAVERAFPNADPHETVEVDAIGFSMGGLVARCAAVAGSDANRKRLRIRRLFTISTPHRGARMAPVAFFDRRAGDMRAESRFLAELDAAMERQPMELHCYGLERDLIVGVENCAPAGHPLTRLSRRGISPSHLLAGHDPRILADIAGHLRGERR